MVLLPLYANEEQCYANSFSFSFKMNFTSLCHMAMTDSDIPEGHSATNSLIIMLFSKSSWKENLYAMVTLEPGVAFISLQNQQMWPICELGSGK